MKPALAALVVSFGICANAQAPGPPRDQSAPSAGGASIAGRVFAADTGNPLAQSRVQISSTALAKPRSITTDAHGRFEATSLGAGRYRILVTRAGFVSLEYGQTRPHQSGRDLELLDGQKLDRIDFAMSRGGVITGRITDQNGEPQAGVQMNAMRLTWALGGARQPERASSGFFDRILTDDLGQYRIYGLPPGSYIVAAGAGPGIMGMPEHAVPGTTYFPGTPSIDEAQSVEVGIAQEVSVHFALMASQLARVSGTIVDSGGRPVAWRSVRLASRTQGAVSMRNAGTTRPDGTFDLLGIPPGNYTIEVEPLRTQPDVEFASFPIRVEGHDVTDLMIAMKAGATITGRVVWEGRSPPPFATQRITPVAADPKMTATMQMSHGGGPGNGTVDAMGNFSIVGVHGQVVFHTFFTGRTEPWTLKAVRIGGADITDVGYNVTGDIDGLEVVMTDRETRVSGTAMGERNQPATDYVVVVLPSEERAEVNPIRFIQTARPDQQGRYQVKGLPPGRYVAAAFEALTSDGHFNPAFQTRMRSTATPFTLAEGQQLVLDLPLTK